MLNIQENRKAQKYSSKELMLRVLWTLCRPLFCCSPRVCWGWRVFLLRCFGAKVGSNVHIFPSVRIFAPWSFSIGKDSSIGFDALVYNLGEVIIGDRVTISQRAHLCAGTHDYEDPALPLLKKRIALENDVWLCADSFVGPGVRVEQGAVVAARAVVCRDVSPLSVVAGNPAAEIKSRNMKKPEEKS